MEGKKTVKLLMNGDVNDINACIRLVIDKWLSFCYIPTVSESYPCQSRCSSIQISFNHSLSRRQKFVCQAKILFLLVLWFDICRKGLKFDNVSRINQSLLAAVYWPWNLKHFYEFWIKFHWTQRFNRFPFQLKVNNVGSALLLRSTKERKQIRKSRNRSSRQVKRNYLLTKDSSPVQHRKERKERMHSFIDWQIHRILWGWINIYSLDPCAGFICFNVMLRWL